MSIFRRQPVDPWGGMAQNMGLDLRTPPHLQPNPEQYTTPGNDFYGRALRPEAVTSASIAEGVVIGEDEGYRGKPLKHSPVAPAPNVASTPTAAAVPAQVLEKDGFYKKLINDKAFRNSSKSPWLSRGAQVASTTVGAVGGGYLGNQAGKIINNRWLAQARESTQKAVRVTTTAVGSVVGAVGLNRLVGKFF